MNRCEGRYKLKGFLLCTAELPELQSVVHYVQALLAHSVQQIERATSVDCVSKLHDTSPGLCTVAGL